MYVIKQHELPLEQAEEESILPIAKRHILATEQMKMTTLVTHLVTFRYNWN